MIVNCWRRNFFCFWVANTQATLFQRITPTVRRISGWIMSFLVGGSFKHSVGTDKIDKRTIRKCDTIVSHPGQNEPGIHDNEGGTPYSRALGPFTISLFRVISRTLVRRCFNKLQRCSQLILQLQPTEQTRPGRIIIKPEVFSLYPFILNST